MPGAEWGRGAQGAAGEDTGNSPAWVSSDKHPGAPGHAGPSPDPLCPDVHVQLGLGWSQSCHSLSSNQRGQEPHSQPGPPASHPSHRGCPGHSGSFWSLLNSPQSVAQQVSPEALAWLLQGHSAPLGPAGPRLQTVGWVRQHDIPPGQAWVHRGQERHRLAGQGHDVARTSPVPWSPHTPAPAQQAWLPSPCSPAPRPGPCRDQCGDPASCQSHLPVPIHPSGALHSSEARQTPPPARAGSVVPPWS